MFVDVQMQNKIWDNFNEKYLGNERTNKSSVDQCLLELGEFRQKEIDSIESYCHRVNGFIFNCTCYGVTCSTLEFNMNFLVVLRKEWKHISLMIKTQENFDNYSLSNLYNILKAHENEVKDIVDENKSSLGGPLALVSKVYAKEVETDEEAKNGEKGFLFNSDDEVVAYYLNNKVKKFFRNPFNGKFKNSYETKGVSTSGKSVKEGTKIGKKEVESSNENENELKLKGDSGYNYN